MHALCAGQCDRRGSAGRLIPELADPDLCYVRPTPEQAGLREGVTERRAHAVTSICQHTEATPAATYNVDPTTIGRLQGQRGYVLKAADNLHRYLHRRARREFTRGSSDPHLHRLALRQRRLHGSADDADRHGPASPTRGTRGCAIGAEASDRSRACRPSGRGRQSRASPPAKARPARRCARHRRCWGRGRGRWLRSRADSAAPSPHRPGARRPLRASPR